MKRFAYFIIACLLPCLIFAQSSKRKSELERQRKETQALIQETTRMLSSAKESAAASLNRMTLLTQEINSRRRLISMLNQEVDIISADQSRIFKEISVLEGDLSIKKEKYAQAVRSYHKRNSGLDEIVYILSADNFEQSYRRLRYLQEYANWRKTQAEKIVVKRTELQSKKEELDRAKKEKESLLTTRKNEAGNLRKKESEQKTLADQFKKKERSLQAELKKQQANARKLDQQIQKIIEEEARKIAEAQKKNAGKPKTEEMKAQEKVDNELTGGFEKNKGKLPVPVTGSYLIVGKFGKQSHPQIKSLEIENLGIDIQTKQGVDARCVYDGEVTAIVRNPGEPPFVIIRHGNYLTVYNNLSEIYVKKGEKVKTRQSIGKIFTDPATGATKMKFLVYKGSVKQNPEHWIAK